mmetsp:Transcript_27649/g.46855  ORF Transcript_27649/g.46855 Transcript_27649/m.46855 type:complete len:145 (+) Transcript_27649:298-732(+)
MAGALVALEMSFSLTWLLQRATVLVGVCMQANIRCLIETLTLRAARSCGSSRFYRNGALINAISVFFRQLLYAHSPLQFSSCAARLRRTSSSFLGSLILQTKHKDPKPRKENTQYKEERAQSATSRVHVIVLSVKFREGEKETG